MKLVNSYQFIYIFKFLNLNQRMKNKRDFKQMQPVILVWMIFLGLLLSETHLIYIFGKYGSLTEIFIFSLFYLLMSSTYLLRNILKQLTSQKHLSNNELEYFEFLGIPTSALVLILSRQTNQQKYYLLILIILFIFQCILIAAKVIFLGPGSKNLSSISRTTRLLKIINIVIRVTIILLTDNLILISIAFTVLQTILLLVSCKKFTFQTIISEYCFSTGILCGFISCLDFLVSILLNLTYCFIGEGLFMILLFFSLFQLFPLAPLLEMKYIAVLRDKAFNKSTQDNMVTFILIKQCLIDEEHKYFKFSKRMTTLIAVEAVQMFRVQNAFQKHNQENISEKITTSKLFEEISTDKDSFMERLVRLIDRRFRNTSDIDCLEFMSESLLSLKQNYGKHALINYYRFMEDRKIHLMFAEKKRLMRLHSRIISNLRNNGDRCAQVLFIHFSEKLNMFRQNVVQVFQRQVRLVEYLQGKIQKDQLFPEQLLLQRNENKQKVRQSIKKCIQYPLYVNCNQFKMLFLIFCIGLEKRLTSLQQTIRKLFFSGAALDMSLKDNFGPLVVVKGFGNGQIIKCNQNYKKQFGITDKISKNSTIYNLFPSSHQKHRHIELVNQAMEMKKIQQSCKHKDYECLLIVDREEEGVKFKALEAYRVDTRVYWECQEGFNFVSGLTIIDEEMNRRRITKKEVDILSKKGVEVEVLSINHISQLDETMEVYTILMDVSQLPEVVVRKKVEEKRVKITEDEKYEMIEKKITQEEEVKYDISNILEISLVLALIVVIGVSILIVSKQLKTFEGVIVKDIWGLRLSTLVTSKIILEGQILSIVNGTQTTFLDDMCLSTGIPSLSNYIIGALNEQIYKNYNPLLMRLSRGEMNPLVAQRVADVDYRANGMTWTGAIGNITYVKMIQLLKQTYITILHDKTYNQLDRFLMMNYMAIYFKQISLSGLQRIYQPIQEKIYQQFNFFSSLLFSARILLAFVTLGIVTILSVLRVYGNRTLMGYYDAISELHQDMLENRMRQLDKILDKLKIIVKEVPTVEIQPNLEVFIRKKSQQTQRFMTLNSLTQVRNKNQDDSNVLSNDENASLLQKTSRKVYNQRPASLTFRLLIYSRSYLFLMLIVLVGIITFNNLFCNYSDQKFKALDTFYIISEETSKIQQEYTNLLAYNWLKTLSYESNMTLTPFSEILLNDSMAFFAETKINSLLESSYSKQFSLSILNQNVCRLFRNQTFCQTYHNGIFHNGFSILLPTTLKGQQEINNFSTVYTDYLMHLCQTTKLLYEGVVPMTQNIPMEGFVYTSEQIDRDIPMLVVILVIEVIILVALPLVYQCRNYGKVRKIREEVLSLNSIAVLYQESTLKPYLNEVYYS